MIVSDAGFLIATPTKCGTTTLEEMARRHAGGRLSRGGVWQGNFRIADWDKPRRQHSMCPPAKRPGDPDWDNVDRYFMMRNPYDRWVSIFEYLRAPQNYSKWGAKQVQGAHWRGKWQGRDPYMRRLPMTFGEFLEFILAARADYSRGHWKHKRGPFLVPFHYRSPWIWLDSLTTSATKLRNQTGGAEKVTGLAMEHLWENMAWLKDLYGLDGLSVKASIHANKSLVREPVGKYWDGVDMCGAHVVRGEDLVVAAAQPGCGECVPCVLGVWEEAARLGYFRTVEPVRVVLEGGDRTLTLQVNE